MRMDTYREKRSAIKRTILSVIMIVIFVCIIFVYYMMLYNQTRDSIISKGRINAIESADQIEQRMSQSLDVIKLAAYTLDNMIRDNRSQEEILDYLNTETAAVGESLIADTTGVYGYIRGEYMDGSGWVPDEGYDPTIRPWYVEARNGKGKIVIVDPYVDLDTGDVMIALSQMLSDNQSVVGIDLSMSDIQSIIEDHVGNGQSYSEFIVNRNGLIVAHSEIDKIGMNIFSGKDTVSAAAADRIRASESGHFYLEIENRDLMVYIMPLEYDWTCVSVIDATDDFDRLRLPLLITIMTAIILAGALAFFMIRSEKKSREARESALRSERALAASEAKSSFLSNMSHEIRTPINAILGMNEMILREAGDESVLAYSDNIKSAGNSLLSIINDILDFSKIEAGKMEIIPVDYELSSVINDLVNMIHDRAANKGLELEVSVDKDIPGTLHGDEVRIKQIITNILTNAVKYTEKGTVTFAVGYEQIPQEYDSILLCVSVKDTGIGIRKEDIKKLFSKFQRIDEERNRNVEGTGLGMNITRSLLDLMGSALEVESEYGKGSMFSFKLKQNVVNRTPVGDYESTYRERLRKRPAYREKFTAPDARVLVVDDNEMNLVVFRSLIKQTLISIDTAPDGDSGIALTRENHYDILFLDHMMPGKDGIETLNEIRKDHDNPNALSPAICLTANAVSGAREQYLSAGFDDYLTKPVDAAALEEMLLSFIPKDKIEDPKNDVFEAIRQAADDMDCTRLEEIFNNTDTDSFDEVKSQLFGDLRIMSEEYRYEDITERISQSRRHLR